MTHLKASVFFCQKEKLFVCLECIKDHADHPEFWLEVFGSKIYQMFQNDIQVLQSLQNQIGEQILKMNKVMLGFSFNE